MKKLFLKITLILVILIGGICTHSLAVDNDDYDNYSILYKNYLELSEEEKANVDTIPIKYNIPMDYYLSEYARKSAVNRVVGNLSKSKVGDNLPSSYILSGQDTNNDGVVNSSDIVVSQYGGLHLKFEDQGPYGLCWAFASLNSLETYLQLHGYGDYDYSEFHLDYMDVIMERSKNADYLEERSLHDSGNCFTFLEYIHNGDGPVLEEEVPYNTQYNTPQEIEYLKSLRQRAVLSKFTTMQIIKENGTIRAYNGQTNQFEIIDDELLEYLRTEYIKKHIMENGGIYSVIYSRGAVISDVTGTYVVNGNGLSPDHGVTIVGWDDNFSRYNFPESIRPQKDGAYICLNTWQGNSNSNYIYVSYEDSLIEAQLFGVTDAQIVSPWELKIEGTPKTKYFVGESFSTDGISIKAINQDGTSRNVTNQCVITPNVLTEDTTEVTITYTEDETTFNINVPVEVTESPYKVIQFNDKNMYDKVVQELGDKIYTPNPVNLTIQMTQEDIDAVEELRLQSFNGAEESVRIGDITGIERFTNLKTLYLYNNKIENIDKLENLTKLEELWLSSNRISNIDKLARLTNLKKLDISWNEQIENVKPLENMTELTELVIQNNKIKDISDLSKLTKLTSLLASNNEIENIDVISNFVLMDELQLENNEIRDISPLHGLNNLRVLILANNKISDLGGLPNTDTLVEVSIRNNRIDHIDNLPSNVRKDVLYLKNQTISMNPFGVGDEVDLPQLFIEVKDPTSPLYTEQEFTLSEGISLVNDGKTVKFEEGVDVASVGINGGRADGTVVSIDRRSEIPMTDLYLDKTELVLALDEFDPQDKSNRRLKATYLPENTTSVFLTWNVEDRSIVNIEDLFDNEGENNYSYASLVPLKVGKTKVTISADGTSLSATCDVTVVATRSKILKDTSTYRIEDGYLLGIKTKTSLDTLRENINEVYTIKVKKEDNSAEVTTGNVGTGMVVEVYKDGTLKETLTIVIKGDINGDGKASGPDALMMLAHRKGTGVLTGIKLMAGDIVGNDNKIKGQDALELLMYRKGIEGHEL